MKVMVIPIIIGAFGTVPQKIGKRNGRVGNWETCRDYPNYRITEICQNSTGDLKEFAVTLLKDHQLTPVWKNSQGIIIVIIIIIIIIMQRIQRHSRITLHRSTHPKWEQDKTEKSSYGLDWLQKGIWYGPTKLDNTLSQNVQNITWSHKLHWKNHANLESEADNRKKLSWNKDLRGIFQGDALITLTIHNSHDATSPHTQKMHCQIQT